MMGEGTSPGVLAAQSHPLEGDIRPALEDSLSANFDPGWSLDRLQKTKALALAEED